MLRGSLPPMSNRESLIDDIQLVDGDDGSLWDLTDVTAQVRLERTGDIYTQPQYLPYFNYGAYQPASLLATTENGSIVLDGTESLVFTFTETQMASLPCGQYRLSCVLARYGISLQMFQYDIPILDGGVPT